jgi:hypothetical protein
VAFVGWFASDPAKSDAQSDGQALPAPQTVVGEAIPREVDIQNELRVINAELDRLEAAAYASDRYLPRYDPLRQIEFGLDALEREIGVREPAESSKAESKRK